MLSVSPLNSRNSTLFSFGLEKRKNLFSYAFKFRPALADLLDFNEGYSENSTLEMGVLDFRYINNLNKFYIKDFTVVNVVSLVPTDAWFKKSSWGIKFGYSIYERGEKENLINKFYIETLRGYSFDVYWNSLIYIMIDFSMNYLTEGKDKFKPSIGPFFGFLGGNEKLKYNISLKLKAFKNDRGFFSFDLGSSLRTTKNSNIKLNYTKTNLEDIYSISYNIFISQNL